MAAYSSSLTVLLLLLHVTAMSMISMGVAGSYGQSHRYKAIYSFGDSLADTGNLYYDTEKLSASHASCLHLPYGETYFHRPTGRCSDGRLIVDFLAQKMGLPLLKPYLGIKNGKIKKDWKAREGVNFAVAGATALNSSFFIERGILNIATNYSLAVQLDWFKHFLPSICNSSSDCKKVLGSSLFLVGEIGGNDFNHPLFLRKSVEEIKAYIPFVINEISSAINKLIHLGARTMIVPGNFPIGCNVIYLRIFNTTNMKEYDEAGCLKRLNELAQDYNKKLRVEINRLQRLYPNTNIIYADYYHASLQLYQSPTQFGFTKSILDSCCPLANANYHNAPVKHCGEPGLISCNDPSQFITWDGVHLTEAAYKRIAKGLLKGSFTNPKIGISCDSDI
ncbi:GDSL esterase/lipase At1g28580 [Arachis ipaensis]|uniref:GDSL esterase/lipase At1g28580 n=1 Tax=Arachis ipaensis TaxID=130454 RepID=UPI000A2B74A0|nr:GDSL esterase/lipase At1g28580 [Arachis ipaensis]